MGMKVVYGVEFNPEEHVVGRSQWYKIMKEFMARADASAKLEFDSEEEAHQAAKSLRPYVKAKGHAVTVHWDGSDVYVIKQTETEKVAALEEAQKPKPPRKKKQKETSIDTGLDPASIKPAE